VKHISFLDAGNELLKRTCREIILLKFLADYNDQVVSLKDILGLMDPTGRCITEVLLILELMEQDLAFYIKKSGPLPIETLKTITIQILNGLYIIHKRGIIHRDIKPQNILLTTKPEIRVKLGDFGTGRFVASNSKKFNVSHLLAVSTFYYCAPEGLLNPTSYGNSVDIWALGCIVYEMLTKKPLLIVNSLEVKDPETGILKKMIEICGKPKDHEIEDASDTRLKSYVLQLPESDTLPLLEQQKKFV